MINPINPRSELIVANRHLNWKQFTRFSSMTYGRRESPACDHESIPRDRSLVCVL